MKGVAMDKATLTINNETFDLPVITGSMNEKAIDISELRKKSGYITLDPGYQNTGSCLSDITFIDGEKGVLKYRGIDMKFLLKNRHSLKQRIFSFTESSRPGTNGPVFRIFLPRILCSMRT